MTKRIKVGIIYAMIDLVFLGRLIDSNNLVDENFSGPEKIRAYFIA